MREKRAPASSRFAPLVAGSTCRQSSVTISASPWPPRPACRQARRYRSVPAALKRLDDLHRRSDGDDEGRKSEQLRPHVAIAVHELAPMSTKLRGEQAKEADEHGRVDVPGDEAECRRSGRLQARSACRVRASHQAGYCVASILPAPTLAASSKQSSVRAATG